MTKEKIEILWFDSDEDFEKGIKTSVKEAVSHASAMLEALDARREYPKHTH